jgi:hypothetical protein
MRRTLSEVLRIFEGNVGVPEVELEAGAEVGVLGAAGDLFEGVVLEGVHAAEAEQPLKVFADLGARRRSRL